ncbi:MAG: hypothetical protein QOJ40_2601 [Verrucomicrobiota bacterium]
MNRTKVLTIQLAILLCGPLLQYSASGQPSASVRVNVPLPSVSVEIRSESDFYEPLAPHGEWVVVGSYGRCWRPGHVARDWRPYCNGRWENTDAGWYWVSDEPWAWATYHYGRWDFTDQYGWYWVPQTQWAPAWVSWHEGGGYVGWAPLQPSVTVSVNGYVGFNQSHVSPRAFVFVKQGQFLEPIRPTMVAVNNTTIINKTVTITNTKIVNNTVINGGPATTAIEKASGRKVQAVPMRDLRQKDEAVVAKQRTQASTSEKKNPPPARSEAVPREQKAVVAPAATQVEKPAATPRAPAPITPTGRASEGEKAKNISSQSEPGPQAYHPDVNQQPSEQKADKRVPKQQTPVRAPEKKAQRPPQERPAPQENSAPNPGEKDHENKPKQ